MPGGRPRIYTPEEAKRRKAAQRKAWNLKNADRMAAWTKAWQEANRERIKENRKKYMALEENRAAAREADKAWRKANPDKVREMKRLARHRNPEKERAKRAARKARNPETERLAQQRRWVSMNRRNPEKVWARKMLQRAVDAGRAVRQPCSVCGDPKSHGHHANYRRPLDVVWLCSKHHLEEHRRIDAEKASEDLFG
jgi:hypothetical protein